MSANPLDVFKGASTKGKTAGGLIPAASLKQASRVSTPMKQDSANDSKTGDAKSGTCDESKQQPKMVSGTGQYHSDKSRKYDTITWDEITALVDEPMQVDKSVARWFIPSTTLTRTFEEQRQNGVYYALWADLDGDGEDIPPPEMETVTDLVSQVISDTNYEIYSSRSARADYQKSHVIIPLAKPIDYGTWTICQEILNDMFDVDGYKPDRRSQEAAQICYLPNRGNFYETSSKRGSDNFNPEQHWQKAIAKAVKSIAEAKALAQAKKEAAQARRLAVRESDVINQDERFIDVFNKSYDVGSILTQAGYDEGHTDAKGTHYKHPSSETGNYSACVFHESGKVYTLSSNDKLYNDGNHAHDAFSAFRCTIHNGDMNAALKDAGDNWIMVGNDSWNKVAQRKFMQSQRVEPLDFSNLVDARPLANVDADTGEIISVSTPCPPPFRGVMKAIVDATLDAAPSPQPELAIAGALAGMAAGCSGQFKLPDNARLNLYLIGIAGTGWGKDLPRTVAIAVARAANAQIIGKAASGQGLEDAITDDYAGMITEVDEIAHLFEQLNGKHRPSYLVEMASVLLRLFSASANIFNTRLRAKSKGIEAHRSIKSPCLSLIGFATPENLGAALTTSNADDGLLGRLLFTFGRPGITPRRIANGFALPQVVKDQGEAIRHAVGALGFSSTVVGGITLGSAVNGSSSGEIEIAIEEDANAHLDELIRKFHISSMELQNPLAQKVLMRSYEKCQRIAGVLAVWDCPTKPVITREHTEWAEQFTGCSDAQVMKFLDEYMHGGEILANAAAVMKIIERVVSGGFEPQTARDIDLVKRGYAPHSLVLKRSKMDSRRFTDAIGQLLEEGRIYCNEGEVTTGRGKKMNCKYYEILDE